MYFIFCCCFYHNIPFIIKFYTYNIYMKKKNFKAHMLLNKKFSTELSGYNPTEVDEFFDKIIEDYRLYEERVTTLDEIIEESNQLISEKDDEIKQLNLEIMNIKDQLKQTEKATNVELMKEVREIKESLNNKTK